MKNILQNMQCIIKKLHLTNKNLRRFSNVQMKVVKKLFGKNKTP